MKKAYIGTSLSDVGEICSIRNRAYAQCYAEDYYKIVEPHITIVPPFDIKEGKVDEVEEIVENSNIAGTHVNVQGLDVWKSVEDPIVVMLDVEVDIEDERDRIIEELNDGLIDGMKSPVEPHITLFKRFETSREVPEDIKDRISRVVDRCEALESTTIQNVYLKVKG